MQSILSKMVKEKLKENFLGAMRVKQTLFQMNQVNSKKIFSYINLNNIMFE